MPKVFFVGRQRQTLECSDSSGQNRRRVSQYVTTDPTLLPLHPPLTSANVHSCDVICSLSEAPARSLPLRSAFQRPVSASSSVLLVEGQQGEESALLALKEAE